MLTVKPWKKLSVCVSIDIFQLLLTVVPEFVIHDFWQPEQKHTSTELQELDRIHAQSIVEIEGWGWEGSWGREGEGPGGKKPTYFPQSAAGIFRILINVQITTTSIRPKQCSLC